MLRVQKALLFAILLGLTNGQSGKCKHHQNNNPDPSGNPIGAPLAGEKLHAGKAFDITWTATGSNPISLVLLRGPRNNAEEYLCIADAIENSGTYSWTPPETLQGDSTNYGLKIIDDESGDYQYSPLFGIKNPKKPKKAVEGEDKEKKKEKQEDNEEKKHEQGEKEKKKEGEGEEKHKKGNGKGQKSKEEHKMKTCTEEKCAHPTKKPEHKQGKHHPKVGAVYHNKYHNNTVPYPTGTASSTTTSHSKTKSKKKPQKTKSPETSTSTSVETSTETSSENPGEVTSMVVASGGAGVPAEPPTVTTNAPGQTSNPATFNNVGPTMGVSGGMLAGAFAMAALVL